MPLYSSRQLLGGGLKRPAIQNLDDRLIDIVTALYLVISSAYILCHSRFVFQEE